MRELWDAVVDRYEEQGARLAADGGVLRCDVCGDTIDPSRQLWGLGWPLCCSLQPMRYVPPIADQLPLPLPLPPVGGRKYVRLRRAWLKKVVHTSRPVASRGV